MNRERDKKLHLDIILCSIIKTYETPNSPAVRSDDSSLSFKHKRLGTSTAKKQTLR